MRLKLLLTALLILVSSVVFAEALALFFGSERVIPTGCVLSARPSTIEPSLYYYCKIQDERFSIYITNLVDAVQESDDTLVTKEVSRFSKQGLQYFDYVVEVNESSEWSSLPRQYATKICDHEMCVAVIAFNKERVADSIRGMGL